MKIHINYAHGRYLESQRKCCESALQHGFDLSKPYGFSDLSPEFVSKNSYTLSQARGAGFWVWKPHLINKTLQTMGDGDWLMYTDSGMYFVRDPWKWILAHEKQIGEKGIATFDICGMNKNFTKRDAFVLMNADTPDYTDAPHRMASVFVCKKTPFSVRFVEEWENYATDPRIITDLPNTKGLPNYPEFKDHRHDQSIMSILCQRHDTHLFRQDITQFTNPNPYLIHTRNPN
jgi:hypothetical protein